MTAMRMIWSRLVVTAQINHQRGTDLEAEGRQRNLCGIFLRLGMDASWLLHIHAQAASQRFP